MGVKYSMTVAVSHSTKFALLASLIVAVPISLYGGNKGECPTTSASVIRGRYDKLASDLPSGDGDDVSDIPVWFRAYLRSQISALPVSGPHQYPSGSAQVFEWLSSQKRVKVSELESKLMNLKSQASSLVREQGHSLYPAKWEVAIRPGSKLKMVAEELDKEIDVLPRKDLEDRSPLPVWFRVYLRKTFPDLPTSGPYQYPRTANRILQQLLDNPDEVQFPK